MKYLIRLLTVVAFTSLTLIAGAWADTVTVRGTPNEVFRPLSKHIIEKLAEQNVERVGRLRVKKLLEDLDTVEWRTFEHGFLGGSGGRRQTSIYIVKDRMVVINMLALQNLVGQQITMYQWALHEALGALDYPDENYDLTTGLNFIFEGSSLPIQDRINLVSPNFSQIQIRTTDQVYGREGGTTIIGGGGDAPIIEFKKRLLDHFFIWVETLQSKPSERKKKKAFGRLLQQSIEFNTQEANYNSYNFVVKDGMVFIGMGANWNLEQILNDEYMDLLLTELAPELFK